MLMIRVDFLAISEWKFPGLIAVSGQKAHTLTHRTGLVKIWSAVHGVCIVGCNRFIPVMPCVQECVVIQSLFHTFTHGTTNSLYHSYTPACRCGHDG